jgi:uncharacterized protein with ATP-grasp and redox domains
MAHFCKLADADCYCASTWDLSADAQGRESWIHVFEEHTESYLQHARTSDHPPPDAELEAFRRRFLQELEQIRREPERYAPLDIYFLCKLRLNMSLEHGIIDPYDRVKREENEAALARLSKLLARLDQEPADRIVETLVRGLLAGNKFDLGAKETVDLHGAGGIDFFTTIQQLGSRPWFVDNLDTISVHLRPGHVAYRRAFFFVDNAGGDVVLGALPLTRYLADQGCQVVIGANDYPSLNDITVTELNDVLEQAASGDSHLAGHLTSGMIQTVGTACDCPLIDLHQVSEACNEAARNADLVILEGMGRAVETNYNAVFTCDAIRVAMIKNRYLAEWLGCALFGLIAALTPSGTRPRHAKPS